MTETDINDYLKDLVHFWLFYTDSSHRYTICLNIPENVQPGKCF